jgi:hypothetical protein
MQNLNNLIGTHLQKSISMNISQNSVDTFIHPAYNFNQIKANVNMHKKTNVQFNEPPQIHFNPLLKNVYNSNESQ